jgi:hypothetical protein
MKDLLQCKYHILTFPRISQLDERKLHSHIFELPEKVASGCRTGSIGRSVQMLVVHTFRSRKMDGHVQMANIAELFIILPTSAMNIFESYGRLGLV